MNYCKKTKGGVEGSTITIKLYPTKDKVVVREEDMEEHRHTKYIL